MVRKGADSAERIAYREKPVAPAVLRTAPVWIEVSLSAIRHNFRQIRASIPSRTKILAVVKANAYGHGLLPAARAMTQAGADLLGVASVVEGVALRQAGLNLPILILGQCLPEEAPLVVQHQLIQAVGDLASARALSRAACSRDCQVAFHLKVDTGMGRYGVWHEEAPELHRKILQLPGLRPEGIMSHLAMAAQSVQVTQEQMSRFSELLRRFRRERLPTGTRHLANSVGMIRFPDSHWDLVRTGLLLYGVSPLKGDGMRQLQPALTLKSRIRFLKRLKAGHTVSYGGTFRAERPTGVATIPAGYAHGYPRALSNRADVLIRGRRARVIGLVTMEDLMVDVTEIPGVSVGDEVVLIGRQGGGSVTAEELARHARTIPYEILVGLSPAIPRITD